MNSWQKCAGLFCASALAGVGIPASAAPTGAASGTALASVMEPVSVTAEQDLDFGELADGQDRSITIDPSNDRLSGDRRAGRFRVRGAAGLNYRIALPSQVFAEGSRYHLHATVTELRIRTRNSGATDGRGSLDSTGNDVVFVGGTLRLKPDMPSDRYIATVVVQVSYD